MSATQIDEAKLEAFMGQAVTDMGAIMSAPLMVIGEKLGLYKAMAGAGPLTSQEVAHVSPSSPSRPSATPDSLRLLITSPLKLRESILLSELLQPPLALRRPTGARR